MSSVSTCIFSLTFMIRMSSEVCQLCLEALTPLAEQCAKAQETDSPLFLATRHFLKVRYLGGRLCHLRSPSLSLLEQGRGGLWFSHCVSSVSSFLVHFQLVFDMLVLQKHNTEMTTAAGEAFYTLVCLHQVRHGSRGPLILLEGDGSDPRWVWTLQILEGLCLRAAALL